MTPRNLKLQEFYDYSVDQWMKNDIIKVYNWNCHKDMFRTNNIVEGWHQRMVYGLEQIIRRNNNNNIRFMIITDNYCMPDDTVGGRHCWWTTNAFH